MNNLIFDLRRFSLLLRKELFSENKRMLIIAGAILGLMILFAIFMIYTEQGYHSLNFNFFPLTLFGGGFVFTSVIFHEFNDKTGVQHYLSLPASTLEKFVSKWLVSAILFPIAFVILFWIYNKIGDSIYYYHDAYIVENYQTWSLNNWWSWLFIKIYLVIQTLYLIGAIAFQKYTFFKTSLTTFLIGAFCLLLGAIVFRMMYAEYFETLFETKDINVRPSDGAIHFMENTFVDIMEIIFWYLLPATMLVIGFFKLKEKEA